MCKTGKLNQHCKDNFMAWEVSVQNQEFVENQWANLTWQWTPDNSSPGEAEERRLQILVKPGLHCSQSKTVPQQRKDGASLVAYWRRSLQGSAAPGPWIWTRTQCALCFSVEQWLPPSPTKEWAASEEVKHHPTDGRVEFQGLLELPFMFIFI